LDGNFGIVLGDGAGAPFVASRQETLVGAALSRKAS